MVCTADDRRAGRQRDLAGRVRGSRARQERSAPAAAHRVGPCPRRLLPVDHAGGGGIFAVFLFLTYYMQENLGFSPLKTGLAFLPMTAVLVVASTTVQTKVLHRTGVKPLVAGGMALGLIAMLLLTRLSPALGTQATCCPLWSSSASGWVASSRLRLVRPRSESTVRRQGWRLRWSTPLSRWVARSAPHCSARCSPAQRRAMRPVTYTNRTSSTRRRSMATPWRSRGLQESSPSAWCSHWSSFPERWGGCVRAEEHHGRRGRAGGGEDPSASDRHAGHGALLPLRHSAAHRARRAAGGRRPRALSYAATAVAGALPALGHAARARRPIH